MIFNTPIHKIENILNSNNFYIKRDDLVPFSFGGNKARKAVYFFKEIEKNNCDTVITYGSSGSNHCRIIANMAAAKGLKCYIISPIEEYIDTSNVKIIGLFGADIIKTPVTDVSKTIKETIKELSKKRRPYFIQGGGHGNLGTQAYVDVYKEISEFEIKNNIKFDYIFHASGTGTTQAGLVVGQIMAKDENKKIVGISIARKEPYGKDVVIGSIKDYLGDVDCGEYVIFTDEYICGGYGKYNREIADTVKKVLIKNGIALNTTYTGKAFWGMNNYIQKNDIEGKNILFINTGGTPLFFDDLEKMCR